MASASAWGEVSAWALVRNAEVGFDRHASAQSRVWTLVGISDQRKAEASFEVSLAPGLPARETEIFLQCLEEALDERDGAVLIEGAETLEDPEIEESRTEERGSELTSLI